MFEADGGFGIVARAFHPQHLAVAEAFVLDQLPCLQAFPTRRSRSGPRYGLHPLQLARHGGRNERFVREFPFACRR